MTTNSVDTTRRQKVSPPESLGARSRPWIQPTSPPTRKATATIAVTPTEAITGNSRAKMPSTSIRIPSATVNARRERCSDRLREVVMTGVIEVLKP